MSFRENRETEMIRKLYIILLLLSGCVAASPQPKDFEDTEQFLGQNIVIRGYLKFGFENRNLFPTKNWERDWDKGQCVPIGIGVSEPDKSSLAKELENRYVEISGTIEKLIADDEINVSFCKEVGLRVHQLQVIAR